MCFSHSLCSILKERKLKRKNTQNIVYYTPKPGADQKEIRKRGPSPQPSPHPLNEYFTFQDVHAAHSIVDVFVMQSKVTLTFRKIELQRIL